jgi:hypothetical protein
MLLTMLALLSSAPAAAHEAGANARGVVEKVTAERIEVKATDGHVVAFTLTPRTRFSRGEKAVSAGDVRVGERAVVRGKKVGDRLEAVLVKLAARDAVHAPH